MKKSEPWINTITQVVTYLFRCNTDITCLLSGTAIKAVAMYVSDYITKSSLKTHTIFESIRSVFHKNSEMIGGSLRMKEKAAEGQDDYDKNCELDFCQDGNGCTNDINVFTW